MQASKKRRGTRHCESSVHLLDLLICALLLPPTLTIPVDIPRLRRECYSVEGDINLALLVRLRHGGDADMLCGEDLYVIERLSYLEAFVFAVTDINRRIDILPGITLGFLALDSCARDLAALGQSLYFIPLDRKYRKTDLGSRRETDISSNVNCASGPPEMRIVGVVGPPSSGNAVLVASLLSTFQIPVISPTATSEKLSDKALYKYFLRVVPSDKVLVDAMIDFIVYFNWTYVSLLYSQGNYGLTAAELFGVAAKRHGVCLAVNYMLPTHMDPTDAESLVRKLVKYGDARLVVLYLQSNHQRRLFDALRKLKVFGKFMWLASDAMVGKDYGMVQDGAFVLYHIFPPVKRFETYFSQLTPQNNARNPWMKEYWEKIHNCHWGVNATGISACSDHLHFEGWDNYIGPYVSAYTDSVYSFGHALHTLIETKCPWAFENKSELSECLDGPTLLGHLRNLSFIGNSGPVQFNQFGENKGKFSFRQYDSSMPTAEKYTEIGTWNELSNEFKIRYEKFNWHLYSRNNVSTSVFPESICSRPCNLKEYVIMKEVICCWECRRCRDNEIIVENGSGCTVCDINTWPDDSTSTVCLPLSPRFLQWTETIALILTTLVSFGVVTTVATMIWFVINRNLKLIKASSRPLSAMILFGILFAFLTVFVNISPPAHVSCMLSRLGFAFSVTCIYAPLLVKTLQIYRIFSSGKRGQTNPKFINNRSQLLLTTALLTLQVVVSSISFIASPPDVRMRMPVVTQKFTELYCDLRLEGLLPPLAYNLSLVLVTAILGYLTRKLPENYNESWYIFVSVATTMFLWVVFVPTYLTTFFVVHQVVLLTCCVMINATVTLFCLFLPKIYAVYFVDEQHLKLFTRTTRVSQASTSPEQRHNDSTC